MAYSEYVCGFTLYFCNPADMELKKAAKASNLINRLGRPDVSSFSTFAYSAGLHLDDDICISHGRVVQRNPDHVSTTAQLCIYLLIVTRFTALNPTLFMVITSSLWSLLKIHTGFGVHGVMHMGQHHHTLSLPIPKPGNKLQRIEGILDNGQMAIQFQQGLQVQPKGIALDL
jgi:hypothetical protein